MKQFLNKQVFMITYEFHYIFISWACFTNLQNENESKIYKLNTNVSKLTTSTSNNIDWKWVPMVWNTNFLYNSSSNYRYNIVQECLLNHIGDSNLENSALIKAVNSVLEYFSCWRILVNANKLRLICTRRLTRWK